MTSRSLHRQSGFSLLESLLVVGLLSGILVILNFFLQEYMRREQMRAVAEYMQLVQKAVTESVNSIEKFDQLYALAASTGVNVAEIPILGATNPNRTYNIVSLPANSSLERGSGALPPSSIVNTGFDVPGANSEFRDVLPIRASSYLPGVNGPGANPTQQARLTVLVRIADNPADVTDQRALEVLIVSVDRIAESDLRGIAQEINVQGGLISQVSGAGVARSVYGDWQTPLAGFTGTRWFANTAARPATLAMGGYLTSYLYLNEALMAGDYLYRKEIAGNPSLNRMNTALDLGGNDVVGADNVQISGNFGTAGNPIESVYAQGSVFVNNNLQVSGDMVVEDDVAAGNMTVARSYDTTRVFANPYTFGNITVENQVGTGALTTSGDLYANSAQFRNVTTPRVSTSRMTVGTNVNIAHQDGLYTKTLTAREARFTDTEAGNLNATGATNAASMGVVEGVVSGNLSADINSANATVDRATIHNLSTTGALSIHNVIRCDQGCED